MSDDVRDYLSDLEDRKDQWKRKVANPYAAAYVQAANSFKETIDSQAAYDQMKVGLAILALSICGGAMVTAAFGTTVLGEIAGERALDAICRRNMDRTFQAAHFVATNKVASFVAGKVWEESESALSDRVKSGFTASVFGSSKAASDFIQDPLTVYISLENFILDLKIRAYSLGEFVRDSSIFGEAQKAQMVAYLRRAAFFNPPAREMNQAELARDIELSMYMALVLRQDILVETVWYGGPYYGGSKAVRTPIADLPSSSAYPQTSSTMTASGSGFGQSASGRNATIEYDQLGSKIRDRIKQLYQREFFTGPLDAGELNLAERTLYALNEKNLRLLVSAAQ